MDLRDKDRVLNLANKHLKKLHRNIVDKEKHSLVKYLHLDNNQLQKIECLACFTNVIEFTASQNQLLRMYNVACLKNLVNVDLSHNRIMCIEGLKNLIHLTSLNLSHNKIKEIDHLFTNEALEHLDLSDNLITTLSNLSHLPKLKKLFLHKNAIYQLRHADVYLPKTIDTLTLAYNDITDLNEISFLVSLANLKEISLKGNPCIEMAEQQTIFDYRSFIVNWCLGLTIIDDYAVDELESLRGEWLYSQGRGRKFRPGEHAQLVHYLSETPPFNREPLQSEEERKLRRVLTKAKKIQSQLKNESETRGRVCKRCLQSSSTFTEKEYDTKLETPSPLPGPSKLVPEPETLMSPMSHNRPDVAAMASSKPCSSTDSYICEDMSTMVLNEIRSKKSNSDKDQAATCIQRNWRGYLARNTSSSLQSFYQQLYVRRLNGHILKLSDDVSALKSALEKEHEVDVLQMQAMNALWSKAQQIQGRIEEVLKECVPSSSASLSEVSTQTDIIAVHSPEDAGFLSPRPPTLHVTTHPVTRFVEDAVFDVLNETIEEESGEDE